MHIPVGWMAYAEACALMQDEIARRWDALAHGSPERLERAQAARERASRLRAEGGSAICVMRIG